MTTKLVPGQAWIAVVGLLAAVISPAQAQQGNPVYTDDSPAARDTLRALPQLLEAGNLGEAVRSLQRALDQDAERCVASADDEQLFITVRSRIHGALLADPRLLTRYREAQDAVAWEMLRAGDDQAVASTRLLTNAGLEAELRLAQRRLEDGEFESARQALEELESHPGRVGEPARDAARLLARIASYLDRPELWTRAERWAREAGEAAPEHRPIRWPAWSTERVYAVDRPESAIDASAIPARALWSAWLDPIRAETNAQEQEPEAEQRRVSPGEGLWILPSATDDAVLINDGTWITSWDRFTLEPRWRLRPGEGDEDSDDPWGAQRAQRGQSRLVEDTNTVTIDAGQALAIAGVAENEDRRGDDRLHAIDADSGQLLWSAAPANLDPQLDSASFRGPVSVDGATAVVAARKSIQTRRVISLYFTGVDRGTGDGIWTRLIGSAGALPSGRSRRVADAGLIHEGVYFRGDELGLIAAVQVRSGRIEWIRRLPASDSYGWGQESGWAWEYNAPVVHGDSIFVLTPDRADILRIDRRTGAILARRGTGVLGEPRYLLRVGTALAAVGPGRIAFLPADDIASGAVALGPVMGGGIFGRVVVAGDRLLVPCPESVVVLDPAEPGSIVAEIGIDNPGNVLPLGDQMLSLSDGLLNSYLTWTAAEALLERRMHEHPGDPRPAVTHAELAYRAGRHDRVLDSVDRAIAALAQGDDAELEPSRRRLFLLVLGIVDAGHAAWLDSPAPLRSREPEVKPLTDASLLASLIERLGKLPETADERSAYLLASGRQRQVERDPAGAIESYQRVLQDRALADATWRGRELSTRAEIEATRRLRAILAENGPDVYAPFDEQARAEADATDPAAALEIEAIARRFPLAADAPALWTRAAEAHLKAARVQPAVDDFLMALRAIESLDQAGRSVSPDLHAEVGGRLVMTLARADRPSAAAQALSRVAPADAIAVRLTEQGSTIDVESLRAELGRRLAALERLPRIGPRLSDRAQGIEGWTILAPLSREPGPRAAEHVAMLSESRSEVALFGAAPGVDPARPAELAPLWTRRFSSLPPSLVRLDLSAAYLFWSTTDGGSIECIDAADGRTRWRTDPFPSLFAGDPEGERRLRDPRGMLIRIDTPRDGGIPINQLLCAIDEHAVVLAERSGRVAAFDPATGKPLWVQSTPVTRVHECDASGGMIVIAGQAGIGFFGDDVADLRPIVIVYEARTGRVVQRMDDLMGQVQWARLAGDRLIVAMDTGLVSTSLSQARRDWTLSQRPAAPAIDGWIFGDQLFILDRDHSLWLVDLATGRLGEALIDTRQHLVSDAPIEAFAVGPSVAFCTDRGLVVIDRQGGVLGMDALGDEASVVSPVPVEGAYIVLETTGRDLGDGRAAYMIHRLGPDGVMLDHPREIILGNTPDRLVALEGRIVVSAGGSSVVYSATPP